MSSLFPLYESLNSKISSKNLTNKQKQELTENILTLDSNGKELVYALIQYHYDKNSDNDQESNNNKNDNATGTEIEPEIVVPYDGLVEPSSSGAKKGYKCVTWDLANFPPVLCQILFKFVNLHRKTLEEDRKRNELAKMAKVNQE